MFIFWPAFLAYFASLSLAVTFQVTKRPSAKAVQSKSGSSPFKVSAVVNEDNGLDLTTINDLIYLANVTLGGHAYTVQLDTGSSDLWVHGPSSPLPNSKPTSETRNLTYGIGWAAGHISYAPVEFAGITIESQAFIDAANVYNPAMTYGADGILGLGFTSLSTIDLAINSTGSDAGRSLLYNLFEENPSQPNYISFALQRSKEPGDEVEGSFAIGEVEPEYKGVLDTDKIPTFPVTSPKRWTVLLESLLIGSKHITPTTSVPNAPSNKAVVLLDSGTSYTYAPKEIVDAIYAPVPGASFDSSIGQWEVPCEAEIDMALQIGGKIFPVHPLDVTPKNRQNKCVGSFVPGSLGVGSNQFDWLVGDNFLRSVYSVYDFGDFDANNKMGDPYVKLLSLVEPNKASSEFVALRGGTARSDITYNAADNGSQSPSAVTLTSDVVNNLKQLSTFFPIMLGIMALNALVILILVVGAIVYLCRRRRRKSASKGNKIALPRTPMGRMSPMAMSTRNSYVAGHNSPLPEAEHTYEPVSMAITEDTVFVPPSPGFRQFDGKPGDRPKSIATLPSQSKLYQQIGSEDALFSPPTPGFAKSGRPNSVASLPTAPFGSPPLDQPFVAPRIALQDMDDKASVHSRKSQKSQPGDQASVHSRHSPIPEEPVVQNRDSRIGDLVQLLDSPQPVADPVTDPLSETPTTSESHSSSKEQDVWRKSILMNSSQTSLNLPPEARPRSILVNSGQPEARPRSIAVNSSQTSLTSPEEQAATPSTAFYSPNSQTSVTPTPSPLQSATIPPPSVGLSRPPVPPAFRPRSHLRPHPVSTADRPMSVGILPSQQFSPPSNSPRNGSPLRPFALQGSRPSSAALPSNFPSNLREEDITTFEPPAPSFRRVGSNGPGGDRPTSMA